MATYFAVQTPHASQRKTFAQADRVADVMIRKIKSLDVRLLAVRSLGDTGFVFAVVSRHPIARQAVTSLLHREPALAGYRISEETTTIEGPFHWKKEGRSSLERPSQDYPETAIREG
jgi:hypothetical protein